METPQPEQTFTPAAPTERRLGRLLRRLEWAALSPGTVPGPIVVLGALLPAVAAGLLLFRLPALEILAIAVVAGLAAHLAGRWLGLQLRSSPLVPALVAVALVGAGANLPLVAGVAVAACLLELARLRVLPAARIQTGLLAYSAALALVAIYPRVGAVTEYLRPVTLRPAPDPITLWFKFFGGPASPIDPVRLYVGNVPGPVFATSLLAVAIGAVWLWYAHRLSLPLLAGFLVGAAVPCLAFGWNLVFQLDSGPAWFVAALVLGDAAMLRSFKPVQLLMGVVVGLAGVALRSRGLGVEAVALAALGVQLLVALTEGGAWLIVNRRLVVARLEPVTGLVGRVRPRSGSREAPRVEGG